VSRTLKGCQSQGASIEEALANIREAIELYLETLPDDERDALLSREIFTTRLRFMLKPPRWTAPEAEKALLAAADARCDLAESQVGFLK
jgi:hypothetical protein